MSAMVSDELRIESLGGLRISREGEPLTGFVSSKAAALLAYLAITGDVHRRESLAGLFWEEAAEEDARASLRVVLSNLRQTAGRDHLLTDRTTVAFNRSAPYWLDVEEFELLAGTGAAVRDDPVGSWRRAVELYRGDLLEGIAAGNVPMFEEWLTARREYFRQLTLRALDGLIDEAAATGTISGGIEYLTRLLALDPWREDAHRRLMILLVRRGRRNAAILQYERCRELLADELGVEPEPETTRLHESILSGELQAEHPDGEPAAQWPAPTDMAGKRSPDVGPHTSFIGREAELQQIISRLQDSSCRLITLVGPGGIGKSRLALQAGADRRLGFRDGVHVVPLASVSEPQFIVPAIVAAIGVNVASVDDPTTQLLQFLRNKATLLILDNFEHLADGAALLNDILDAAPQVKLLVTSRERLALSAEWLVTVQGLPILGESADAPWTSSASGRLFVERARQAQPGFSSSDETMTSVIRICRMLDGMPLGIELAAAWTRTHTCDEIAARIEESLDFLTVPMRDVPERHRSLRAVFSHSWTLLDRRTQSILQALSVFRGSCLPDAAGAVAGASRADLADLVDKSLLYREASGRYSLHELVRQYVFEQLATSPGSAGIHRRHAAYYADLLQASEPVLKGNEQRHAVRRIRADIDNVRAAWQWAVEHHDLSILGRALDGLQIFTDLTGRLQEGRERLEQTAAAVAALEPGSRERRAERDILHGRLLGWLSRLNFLLGQFNESGTLIDRALALLENHDAEDKFAYALDTRAIIANAQGRRDEALRLQQAAVVAATSRDDRFGMAFAFRGMGGIEFNSGNFSVAKTWFSRGLDVSRAMQDWDNIVLDLSRVGEVARLLGNYRGARLRNEEALAIQRERGSGVRAILPMTTLGEICVDQGRLDDAERYFQQANELAVQMDMQRSQVETGRGLATLMLYRGELEPAQAAVEVALSMARANGFTLGIMRCLELEGHIAARQGDWHEVQAIGNEILRMSTAADNQYQTGRTEILLGRAAVALGDLAQAGQILESAHARLEKTGARPAVLEALVSRAELLMAGADGSDAAPLDAEGTEPTERATELLALAVEDPATWYSTRQRADALLARLAG